MTEPDGVAGTESTEFAAEFQGASVPSLPPELQAAESAPAVEDDQDCTNTRVEEPSEPYPPESTPETEATGELTIPVDLVRLLDVRIEIWQKLLDIEDERQQVLKIDSIREIRSELARQNSELKKIPTGEALVGSREKIKKLHLHQATLPPELELEEEELNKKLSRIRKIQNRVVALGVTQLKLLVARDELNAVAPKAARGILKDEPLYQACQSAGIDMAPLVGWTYYAAGLDRCIARNKAVEKVHKDRLAEATRELSAKSSGLMGRFRKPPRKELACLPEIDPAIAQRRRAAERELGSIEQMLSEFYWKKYEEIALVFAAGRFDEQHLPAIRAYLRFGLVCSNEFLIDKKKTDCILQNCHEDVYKWKTSCQETYVVYADEYIKAIYDKLLSVSPDEDLELNGRGSDEWKADRTLRIAVSAKAKIELYQDARDQLVGRGEALTEEIECIQKQLEEIKDDDEKKEEISALRSKLSELRPEIARVNQMIDKLKKSSIKSLSETVKDAENKLPEAEAVFSPDAVLKREVGFVRRMSRLSARLKTPYLQFVLREHFDPSRDDFHSRMAILKAVKKVEYADAYVFHEVVVPNKKRDRRLTVRTSPAFLIVPARGAMGLALGSRRGTESGKLMLPIMGQRQGALDDIVTEIMSDFGWDCTIETAGADWITSDSYCAGYANVRWNYRKRNPDTQKRAGIDKKQQDRQNWRRHYSMYVHSAEESGKKLFNKCPDVYDVIVKYIGLPPGKPKLSRE